MLTTPLALISTQLSSELSSEFSSELSSEDRTSAAKKGIIVLVTEDHVYCGIFFSTTDKNFA